MGAASDSRILRVVSLLLTICSTSLTVSGELHLGGLIGDHDNSTVTNCFWDVQTSSLSESSEGTGLATAHMQDTQTYADAGWDLAGRAQDGTCEVWQMPQAGAYPVLAIFRGYTPPRPQGQGTLEAPYRLSVAADLAAVYYDPCVHFRLAASLDLSGIHWSGAVFPWFAGTLDGNDMTISHLTVKGGTCLGLFGQLTSGAEIRNVALTDANVAGSGPYTGGLAGRNDGGRVTCCSCAGAIGGDFHVGGLVGDNIGTIIDSHSTGEVGGYDCIGGLIGSSYWGAVADSGSHVTVTGYSLIGGLIGDNIGSVNNSRSSGVVEGEDYTGGLVGLNEGISVSASYSTAKVHGRAFVGGLIGSNWFGDIADCYCTGSAAGLESVGGLAGQNTGAISHCYSIGVPAGDIDIGGFVGRNSGGIAASFWNTETSGKGNACGGQTVNAWGCDTQSGKTTAEMQTAATFLDAGWDFFHETTNGTDDLWWLIEGHDYPRLFWQLPADGSDMD